MDDKHHQEIIIIKRHGGHEEEHHGGAWKIAFADFMTAMMAFFLVLWIINATDKNTKTVISRYFNPLKLEDMSKANKGIRQLTGEEAKEEQQKADTDGSQPKKEVVAKPSKGPEKKEPAVKDVEKKDPTTKDAENDKESADPAHPKAHLSESALLGDPYGSLDQIAGKVGPQGSQKVGGDAGVEPPTVDPDAFVDPFKPVERGAPGDTVAAAKSELPQTSNQPAAGAQSHPVAAGPAQQPSPPNAAAQAHPALDAKEQNVPPNAPPPAASQPSANQPSAGQAVASQAGANQAEAEHQPATNAPEAAKLQNELTKELRAELHAQAAPGIDVQATPEGILISLTDEFNFEMFAVGSAEPQAKVIRIMEKIAQSLKSRPGSIVVRGHTDARPFKSGTYDNWRLSTARAQMAYYMLVRGGLDEKRVERIEGYADRRLKTPEKPEAAENRRIEILLRKDKS